MLQKEQAEEYEARQRKGFKRSESVEKAQVGSAGGAAWAPLPVPRPWRPDQRGVFSRAGGGLAGGTEGGEPPGHLQAEGEVGAGGDSDGFPARYGTGYGAGSGSGSTSRSPVLPTGPGGMCLGLAMAPAERGWLSSHPVLVAPSWRDSSCGKALAAPGFNG